LAWSLAYNVAEVLTIYVVFVGLGIWINPGVVITAYTWLLSPAWQVFSPAVSVSMSLV